MGGVQRMVRACLAVVVIAAFGALGSSPQLAGGALPTGASDGSGVNVYVIDSGIRSTHTEFGGRVEPGVSYVDDGNGTQDCTGHGTHVAGIIGGRTMGVAPNVSLVPVRVINCSGIANVSTVVAGIDWVANNHRSPAVASFSLTAGVVNADIDAAVRRAISAGVTFVAAAGNDNRDACNVSPAHVPNVVAVASVHATSNQRAADSNWGSCVAVFAPGVAIESAWNTTDVATAVDSGTSMASPMVAGLAAQYLQSHPKAKPSEVAERLRMDAVLVDVEDAGPGSPKLLAKNARFSPLW